MELAIKRRLKEELGIECPVHYLYKFTYHAKYKDVGSEHELCHVYVGLFDGEIKANSQEIDDWKFIKPDDLEQRIRMVERWMYAVPASIVTAIVAVVVTLTNNT